MRLDLTEEEINLFLYGAGQLPYVQVAALINKVSMQVNQQQQEQVKQAEAKPDLAAVPNQGGMS